MEARRLPDGRPARERRLPPGADEDRGLLPDLAGGPDRRRLVVAVVAAVIVVGAIVFCPTTAAPSGRR